MDHTAYHLQELAIARDPAARGHALPDVLPGERRILDIGCGAGQTLVALHLDSDHCAVGVDVDERALQLGRTLDSRIQFVRGSAETLPFDSVAFDLVISRLALPYTDIRRSAAEIERVLRPGGRCWLALHPFSLALRHLWRHLKHVEVRGTLYQLYVIVNGVALHMSGRQFRFPAGKSPIESFQTSAALRHALEAPGLTDVQVHRRPLFVVTARKPAHCDRARPRAG